MSRRARHCTIFASLFGWAALFPVVDLALIRRVTSADPTTKSTADQRSEAFKWFSTLEFLDLKDRKFVRVATGNWVQHADDPPENTYLHGFLLKEKGDSFTVLTLSLAEESFEKTPTNTEFHKQVSFDVSDLKAGAAAYLKRMRAPPKGEDRDRRPWGEIHLHPRTEVFVLAWACWRNELHELAAELFDHAAQTPTGYGYDADKPPTEALQKLVANDLAHTEMWRSVVAFGEPAVPLSQILKRFEHIVKYYPESRHNKDAAATVVLLKQMIKEDVEHEKNAKPFDELDKREQIEELIFQLREQNGHQFMQPGSCDIFDSFLRDKEDTPAHKLVKVGYDAVPQLIAHLDDERFTRSVGFHRDFYFSHHVLRVNDCALKILERIAGRRFWQESSTFSYMSKDKKIAETKQKIEEWYAEFRKKGEKRMLVEAVKKGDRDSHDQATRLVEKYPDAALPAILAGIKAAEDSYTRDLLVATAAGIEDDSPLPFLLTELKEGPFAYGRLLAAESLNKRGRPEGVEAMIVEWQGKRPKPKAQPGKKRDESEDAEAGLTSVAGFLAGCGKLEAIAALEEGLRKRSVNVRLKVVSSFGKAGNMSVIGVGGGGKLDPGDGIVLDRSKDLRAAVERLLIAELDDTEERTGMSGTWDGKVFADPRICDVSGHVLSQIAPDKYPFDLSAPLVKRDRAIVELKNAWRKDQGLKPLPLPTPKKIARVPVEKLRPLINMLLEAPDADREKIETQVVNLGLGALPGVLQDLENATKKEERAILDRLARQLASIVDEAVFVEGSVRPDEALATKLNSMNGKPFDPDSFLELMKLSARNLPKGAHAIRLAMDRTGDHTGIAVRIDFLDESRAKQLGRSGYITPDEKAPKDVPFAWNFHMRVNVGSKGLHGGTGVSTHSNLLEEKHADLRGALEKACSAAPNEPIDVRVQLIADWPK